MKRYFRPLVQTDACRPDTALSLAGGWGWFDQVEVLSRGRPSDLVAAQSLDPADLDRLTATRAPVLGLDWSCPRLMGIVNVTPDSFSDGGMFEDPDRAVAQGLALQAGGADILDIGGESTRPGARTVPEADEIARTAPVLRALAGAGLRTLSIDTRKAAVAEAAVAAGAGLINDVSGFDHDSQMAGVVARHGLPVCLMHAQGDPQTMQTAPHYDDVLLDVYDALAQRLERAEALGIPRARVLVDPGIGFGKTLAHNLALLRGISLFHGLGCVVLLGVSRKKFIGTIGGAEQAGDRMPGSIAVALAAVAQGVQILRVHDVAETRQALRLFQAVTGPGVGVEEAGK